MRGVSTRLQRLEARSEQLTIRRVAQEASAHLGIDARELAVELTQVLAECWVAGAITYEETLRYLAAEGRGTPEELHAEAAALQRAMA